MPHFRSIVLFLIASLLLSSAVYRDAMWGGSLLAPLDLGPDLFSEYKFMDPAADGIPQNHYIIDQFTYDLPLQQAIYRAYHEGEIPWWDPYTYGGRPLLADAHVNGTDPLRLLCYAVLPFDLAYNWNYILRGIVTGLGMYLLLCHLGVDRRASAVLALTYQYAGWFTLFFGHPWIQGSFLYFPFLWLAWSRAMSGRFGLNAALGGLLCGLIFYAGNLQSHTYLPLFSMTFLAAWLVKSRREFPKALATCIISGLIGGLLAWPVLVNEVEFFTNSLRETNGGEHWYAHLMAAPVALCSFFPWCFGTFRTLDAARLIGAGGVAFTLFSGAVTAFLSLLGLLKFSRKPGPAGLAAFQSLLLIALYLLIIATPANVLFYSRSAALAGMGLTVAAGLSVQALLEGSIVAPRLLVRGFVGMVLACAATSSCMAWFIYPRFRAEIERKIASDQTAYAAIPSIGKIRPVQIARFPNEVSIRNPEAAVSVLAVVLLGFALSLESKEKRNRLLMLSMVAGALPVLIFHTRFRPKQPITLWNRMLAGGESQKEVMAKSNGGLRYDETGTALSDMIFPNAMAALYRVHGVVGYSALQPPGLFKYPGDKNLLPDSWKRDLFPLHHPDGTTTIENGAEPPSSRFRVSGSGAAAPVRITGESHNSLALDISGVPKSESLVRTDTWYPGWVTEQELASEKHMLCFTKIGPLDSTVLRTLQFEYKPTGLKWSLPAIAAALILATCLCLASATVRRKES